MPSIEKRSNRFNPQITRAGDYHWRATLKRKVETQTRSGGITKTLTTIEENVPVAFEPWGSREFPVNQKRFAETTARFRLRYRTDIDTATDVLIFEGRTYDLKPALIVGRNVELEYEAVEVV